MTFSTLASPGVSLQGGGGSGGGAASLPISGNGATVTASTPLVDGTQTWNNGAVTFTGLKFNAAGTSDANSAASSLLMDLQVNTASRFNVVKSGAVTASTSTATSATNPALALTINGSSKSGLFQSSNVFSMQVAANGVEEMSIGNGPVRVTSTSGFGWVSGASTIGAADTILSRRGAANLRLGAADVGAPVAQTLSVQSGTAGASATTVSISGTALTIAGTITGTIAIGHAVTGTGVTAGTLITAGSGSSWTVNNSQTVGPITAYFNTAGANLTITGSQGSGPSAGGSIIFQVAPAGSAATTAQNALATALTINSDRSITVGALGVAGPNNAIGLNSSVAVRAVTTSFGSWTSFSAANFMLQGAGYIAWSPNTNAESSHDLFLYRDAANTLALRNGANAQEFRVYGTTDGTNSEFLAIKSNTGGTFDIGIRRTGTGLSQNGTLNATATSGSSIVTCLTWGSFGGGFLQTSVGFSSASAGAYDLGATTGSIGGAFRRLILAQYIETSEMTAPAAPAANGVRIYAVDNGSGKTQLMALFATGAAQQIAIEP